MKSRAAVSLFAALLLGASAPRIASASTNYWDPNGAAAQGGNGTWNTVTASWAPTSTATASLMVYANDAAAIAHFGTAAGTVTIANGTAINVNALDFDLTSGGSAGYTIAGGTGSTLNFTGTTPTVTSNFGAQEILTAALAGSAGFTETNATTTGFNSPTTANGYALQLMGDLSGLSGTVNVGNGNTSTGGGYVTLGTGSANYLSGQYQAWNIAANGLLTSNNTGTGYTYALGALSGSGILRNGTSSGKTAAGTDTFQVGALNTNTTFSGSIVDKGTGALTALAKLGTGSLTLSGANTYIGATTVNAGKLLVDGSTAAGSAVTVNNPGTVLGGTGTIGGTVSVGNGAILAAGDSVQSLPGKLTTGALTLQTGSTFNALLASSTSYSTLGAGGLTTNLGAASFSISTTPGATFANGTILDLITTPILGTFTNTSFTSGGYIFTANYLANLGNFDVQVTAVPEPATWLAGGLLFGVLGASQRRRMVRWMTPRQG